MKNTSSKFLYNGIFNYHGYNFNLWRHAANKDKVFYIFCAEIARQVGSSFRYIMNYFLSGSKDNYIINKQPGEGSRLADD